MRRLLLIHSSPFPIALVHLALTLQVRAVRRTYLPELLFVSVFLDFVGVCSFSLGFF